VKECGANKPTGNAVDKRSFLALKRKFVPEFLICRSRNENEKRDDTD
jgi:hypothetical protein